MSDKGVCRTASATPGLLKSCYKCVTPAEYEEMIIYACDTFVVWPF